MTSSYTICDRFDDCSNSERNYVTLTESWLDQVVSIEQRSYTIPWSRTMFLDELKRNGSLCYGIATNNALLAYCFSYAVLDELNILNLTVHPDYRSRKFGKCLITYLLAESTKNNLHHAILEVREGNLVARNLYTSLGFRHVCVRRNYYQDNGENAVVFERSLLT